VTTNLKIRKWLVIDQKNGKLVNMKATLDIPDDLYKRVKARSALEGRAIRSVAIELFQRWIQAPSDIEEKMESDSLSSEDYKKYPWLEIARDCNVAQQSSDWHEIQKSITSGWAEETTVGSKASN